MPNGDDRRSQILELLARNGRLRVADLSRQFSLSEVTIRNDLADLEKEGLLQRVHGGAVFTSRAYHSMPLQERLRTNEEQKRAIARAVAARIDDHDTVMINSGTTTLLVARELRSKLDLTVVTNSLAVAQELGPHCNHMILLGGVFDPKYQFTYGEDALQQLGRYRADKLILSVDGMSSVDGITTFLPFEAQTDRMMIQRSARTIVVADYAKIGRTSFAAIDPIDCVGMLITDSRASQEEIKAFKKRGIEVQIVSDEPDHLKGEAP